jgi:hypothetical protein
MLGLIDQTLLGDSVALRASTFGSMMHYILLLHIHSDQLQDIRLSPTSVQNQGGGATKFPILEDTTKIWVVEMQLHHKTTVVHEEPDRRSLM